MIKCALVKDTKTNMYIGNPDTLKTKSEFHKKQASKRWCSKHGWRSMWGKMGSGEWYKRCFEGNKLNEDCIVGD